MDIQTINSKLQGTWILEIEPYTKFTIEGNRIFHDINGEKKEGHYVIGSNRNRPFINITILLINNASIVELSNTNLTISYGDIRLNFLRE